MRLANCQPSFTWMIVPYILRIKPCLQLRISIFFAYETWSYYCWGEIDLHGGMACMLMRCIHVYVLNRTGIILYSLNSVHVVLLQKSERDRILERFFGRRAQGVWGPFSRRYVLRAIRRCREWSVDGQGRRTRRINRMDGRPRENRVAWTR